MNEKGKRAKGQKGMTGTTKERISCYHCELPITGKAPFTAEIQGVAQPMCCAGCKAVAEMIDQSGLTRYYDFRSEAAVRPETAMNLIPESLKQEMHFYDHPDIATQFIAKSTDKEGKTVANAYLIIDKMTCAACAWLIENSVKRLDGVERFDINLTTHRAHLTFDPAKIKISEILLEILALGYQGTPYDEQLEQRRLKKEWRSLLMEFGIAALFSMQVMTISVALYFGYYSGDMSESSYSLLRWFSLFATIPCATYSSRSFYKAAYYDLKNKRLTMNVNVSIAVIAGTLWSAYNTIMGIGETYYEGVTMFVFLLLGARVLETSARHKSLLISDDILKLKPHFAERIMADGSLELVATNRLAVGDQLMIKPGDSIPVDGILLDQIAMVDESLLSGESLPVEKHRGDALIGGSVNYEQPLKMEVTTVGAETVLSQMTRLIDRSMSEKPKIAKLADIISTYFVLGLLICCVVTFAIWYYLDGASQAFAVTLAVLVVSCPCALALATPSALSAGNQAIIEKGLIATRAGALETLGKVTDIVFDKTGTLTEGRLTINEVISFTDQYSEFELHQIAATLEASSNHPIASGFSQWAYENEVQLLPLTHLHHTVGRGISGEINGVTYKIGRLDWFNLPPFTEKQRQFNDGVWIGLGVGDQLLMAFSLLDHLKSDTVEVVQVLRNQGYRLHILSGDRQATVNLFNETLGIEVAKGDLLPEDKLAYVEDLQAKGAVVSMLGDGINDGPVLAKADVSIAIGQGALLAQSTADMILMSDQYLTPLTEGLKIAKRTDKIITQNLFWALLYNIVAIPCAMSGIVLPWMAALGMSMSSLIVVGNTLRIREGRKE